MCVRSASFFHFSIRERCIPKNIENFLADNFFIFVQNQAQTMNSNRNEWNLWAEAIVSVESLSLRMNSKKPFIELSEHYLFSMVLDDSLRQ